MYKFFISEDNTNEPNSEILIEFQLICLEAMSIFHIFLVDKSCEKSMLQGTDIAITSIYETN